MTKREVNLEERIKRSRKWEIAYLTPVLMSPSMTQLIFVKYKIKHERLDSSISFKMSREYSKSFYSEKLFIYRFFPKTLNIRPS